MLVLSGASFVLPDRILASGTLVVEEGLIADIRSGASMSPASSALEGHFVVPGFVDVHVHGLDGVDTLDPGDPIAGLAARLPRHGVTAFCPTTVACAPRTLRHVLDQVRRARETPAPRSARVLGAHLESNFISHEYRGAQPAGCLRTPRTAFFPPSGGQVGQAGREERARGDDDRFDASDVLHEIERAASDIDIVTLAPELDGGLDLIAWLSARGRRVSLGHSAASYDEAIAAIRAGATQATHLFNRMPPLHHRTPGLAGAILEREEVAAEIICDGLHVHPAMVRAAIAAKRTDRVMAITDGTAAAGLPPGAGARLGGQPIVASESGARLADGTLAGSTIAMDDAFRLLVGPVRLSPVEAAALCSTTPARELGLAGRGVLAVGAAADVVVLDGRLSVVRTYVGGELAYER